MNIRIEISNLANKHLSGVGHYARLLTNALAKDNEVHGFYFNFLNRQAEPIISPNVTREKNVAFPLRVYAKLQSHGLALPFDIFLPKVDLTIFPVFATWPTLRSKKVATVIHDLTFIHFPELMEPKNLAHLKRVVPRSIRKADYIITISETVKQELVNTYSLDPARCVVTYIPTDEQFYEKSNIDVVKKYSLPTKKYIYFVGTMEPRKNLPILIRAYKLLPDSIRKEYSLVIAGGKGWKREETEYELDKALKAGENIIHIGAIDQADSPALYQNASLYVQPSLYEGFGMPVLESFASKTPVLCSDIPILREIAQDGSLYAHATSPEDFAKQMTKILSSSSLQKELVDKAFARSRSMNWDKNVEIIKGLA